VNVGDYIQSTAAKRFLPLDTIGIDREFIAVLDPWKGKDFRRVKTIVNGWFMHAKNLYWYKQNTEAPEKCWLSHHL
jgi:hypothetical protein